MVHVFKKLICIALVLALIKPTYATRGLGIGPAKMNISVSPGEEHLFYLILFNPGDADENVSLKAYCLNCLRDYKIFGFYVGKVNYTEDFLRFPKTIKVEKNTTHLEGKFVEINIKVPKFVRSQIILGNKTISSYILASNLKQLDFRIVATAGEKTKISVVSDLKVKIKEETNYFPVFLIIFFPVLIFLIKKTTLIFSFF